MTEQELVAIEARAENARIILGDNWRTLTEDVPALCAEIRRLQALLDEKTFAASPAPTFQKNR